MFERFSERAREIVSLAGEEARELGHPFIAAEHLLLGAVRVGAVAGLGVGEVRAAVRAALGPPVDAAPEWIPFRPAAKSALEHASEVAADREVLPAHVALAQQTDLAMLRAILRRDGRVAGWLRAGGVDEAWVREFGG